MWPGDCYARFTETLEIRIWFYNADNIAVCQGVKVFNSDNSHIFSNYWNHNWK